MALLCALAAAAFHGWQLNFSLSRVHKSHSTPGGGRELSEATLYM